MSLHRFVSRAPYLALLLGCAMGTMWVFGPLLLRPNAYLLGSVGDALKTYYSVEYFARYGSGHLHTGMNYPYGNHPLFLDMHPLFAYLIRGLSGVGIDAPRYVAGILNLSIMLSFFPCAIFLYQILRRNLLPAAYAVAFALLITFLSPQIFRFSGHLALSYVFFVPMVWYLLPGLLSGVQRGRRLAGFAAVQLIFALIHPYYALVGAAGAYAYLLVYGLQNPHAAWREKYRLAAIALLALLPFPLLKLWEVLLLDGSGTFVEAPYGFLAYIAGFESIFLPLLEPLRGMWNSVIRLRRMETEGYAYVGFAGLLLLAFTLYRAMLYARRRQWRRIVAPVLPADLRVAIWAGTLLLIPAMAYPFQWFPEWVEWLGPLRQFRSPGRLAWIFYYVYMVYCAFLLHLVWRRLRQRGKAVMGGAMLILFFTSWSVSSWVLVRSQQQFYWQQHVSGVPELYADYRTGLAEAGMQADDFQAILALPFYHVGTEKLAFPLWQPTRASFGVSLDTGLPLINTQAARMSMEQGLEAIQLVASPLIPRALPAKLPNRKPLLLSYSGGPLTAGEQFLLDRARPLVAIAGVQLLRLDLDAFAADSAAAVLHTFAQQKDSLVFSPPYTYTRETTDAVVFEGYGGGPGLPGATHSRPPTGQQEQVLFDGQIRTAGADVWMEASVWIRCEEKTSYLPQLDITVFDGKTRLEWLRVQGKESRDYFRGWVRLAGTFVLHEPDNRLVISAKGKRLVFDQLLIRPAAIEVYQQVGKGAVVLYNNFPVEVGSRETGVGSRESGVGRRETEDGRRETGDGRRETGDERPLR